MWCTLVVYTHCGVSQLHRWPLHLCIAWVGGGGYMAPIHRLPLHLCIAWVRGGGHIFPIHRLPLHLCIGSGPVARVPRRVNFTLCIWPGLTPPLGAAGDDCPLLLGWVLGGCQRAGNKPQGSFCAICGRIVCSSPRVGVGRTFRRSHSGGKEVGIVGAGLL